jgi:hypothetical protein
MHADVASAPKKLVTKAQGSFSVWPTPMCGHASLSGTSSDI